MTRHDILVRALDECYTEMYQKAQPSADWNTIIEEFSKESDEMKKKYPLYSRYYLSQEETRDIEDHYTEIYRINNPFRYNIELFQDYLTNGGSRDVYRDAHTDEDGHYHPGYRDYEKVIPIKEDLVKLIGAEKADEVINLYNQRIKWCRDFYGTQREQCSFLMSLHASPNTNAEQVKKYWKEVHNLDIEIDERPSWVREAEDDGECFE